MIDIFNNINIILPIPVKLWTRLCYGYVVSYYRLRRLIEENIRILPEDKLVVFSSITKKGREEIYNILSNYLEDNK